ncbi:hypothetical protein B0T09DRAFT_412387 [Sordaria sp. MPI-SDFR-AT-0083]|nr:hypothetical protein B0T09DRAFT_412387 [Sordaria sp. MPI-SDFR-AT-0083]
MMTYNLIISFISFLTGFLAFASTAVALPATAGDQNAESNVDLVTSPVTHPASQHIQYPRVDSTSSPSSPPLARHPQKRGGPRKLCAQYKTFIDESSPSRSPLLKDCIQIVCNHAGGKDGGGDWVFMAGSKRTIATFGSCAFSISAGGGVAKDQWLLFRTEDVRIVIEKFFMRRAGM